MEEFKRAQVIMLPTQVSNIYKDKLNKLWYWASPTLETSIAQHLYIISDDEIKDGDLYITSDHSGFGFRKYKIIATTDTSLLLYDESKFIRNSPTVIRLPQPSQQFIEKYIESYNKGEVITDVLVEYELNIKHNGRINNDTIMWETIKINPKDNTITIKKLKDSWNRKEVIVLINKLNNTLNIGSDLTLEQWIDKNV